MEDTKFLKKNIKTSAIDVHPSERALVVTYELEATILGELGDAMIGESKQCQKIIRLKDLTADTDAAALATQIIEQCKLIAPSKHAQVEQLIYYLQRRKKNDTGGASTDKLTPSSLSGAPGASPTLNGERASVNKLDEYIELLYEDIADKVRGTALVLQLARNADNLEGMLHNETLLGALGRVLRDDWKKNFELATNIAYTFFCFSTFSPFHPMIGHFKIGALCLQIVDCEVQRYDVWMADVPPNAKEAAKRDSLVQKQEQLVRVCVYLLLNLSEDGKVETKMVARGVVETLCALLKRRHNPDLCTLVALFLTKLAVFRQNVDVMLKHHIVDHLAALVPDAGAHAELMLSLLRLMLNLSFHSTFRTAFLAHECMTPVAVCVNADAMASDARRLLYHMSVDDACKTQLTYTPCLSLILDDDVSSDAVDRTEALMLLVNCALDVGNARMICGDDGGGMRLLFARAFATRDTLVMKVLRNVTYHNDDVVQTNLVTYVGDMCAVIVADLTDAAERAPPPTPFVFAHECLAILANVRHAQFDWAALVDTTGMHDVITRVLQAQSSDDVLLTVVELLGTMASCDEAAATMLHERGYVDAVVALLAAKQEDDEIVLQIIYVFYQMMCFDGAREWLLTNSEVPAYLIDLMHDKNAHIRRMCDSTLEVIAEAGDEWARRIAEERFRWHNAQWLEMVGLSDMTDGGVVPIHDTADVRYALDATSSESDGNELQADELLRESDEDDDDPTLID